jgi:probable phosphoglycerate mutase
MTESTLYFVRHGETEYNRRRIMQGRRIDCSLNDTGRVQAKALAARFADVPLDAIYSSNLARAVETAGYVAAHHPEIPRVRFPGLDEMSWGIYEGEAESERLQRMLDEMYAHWERGAYDVQVEEGESIYEVRDRALKAVESILEAQQGKTVLIVSHGRLLRVLLASVLGGGLETMDDFHHANTCVNVITHRSGRFEASLLNCTAHLAGVDSVLAN